jgi:hypothetical protein
MGRPPAGGMQCFPELELGAESRYLRLHRAQVRFAGRRVAAIDPAMLFPVSPRPIPNNDDSIANTLAWSSVAAMVPPARAGTRYPRRTAPHGSMRQYLIQGHAVPLAPPICSDDFGAALYISPPP